MSITSDLVTTYTKIHCDNPDLVERTPPNDPTNTNHHS